MRRTLTESFAVCLTSWARMTPAKSGRQGLPSTVRRDRVAAWRVILDTVPMTCLTKVSVSFSHGATGVREREREFTMEFGSGIACVSSFPATLTIYRRVVSSTVHCDEKYGAHRSL